MVVLLFVASGCGPSVTAARPTTDNSDDVTLGPGDVFEVRVYGEQELSTNYRVGRDGTIDFPYLGLVEVADLEPAQVASLLERELREHEVMVDPQVSVLVTEYASKRISIIGAVRNPGNYAIAPGTTALQAVGLAGGTTDLANRDGALITRRVEGQMQRFAVPLDRITVGAAEDVRVQAGDIIFIPERLF